MQKGKLGSVVAGVLAIFLVIICMFYLSFTLVNSRIEKQAEQYATEVSAKGDKEYKDAYKHFIDSVSNEKVWLGYTYRQVAKLSIGLGLDLKGGMNVTLQLSVPDILRSLAGEKADARFEEVIARTDSVIAKTKSNEYVEAFYDQSQQVTPKLDLGAIYSDYVKPDASRSATISALKDQVKSSVNASSNVLRQRIDQFGVVSPNIQELENEGQILLELPGVTDHDRMVDLLKASANLEFFLERNVKDYMPSLNAFDKKTQLFSHFAQVFPTGTVLGIASKDQKEAINTILRNAKGELPDNVYFAWGVKPVSRDGGKEYYELYSLKTDGGKPLLAGNVVKDATMEYDNDHGNGIYVSMTMNNDAAGQWASITGAHINERVAIVLDSCVYSAPTIQNQIIGSSRITGDFTPEEAQDLANVLKSGKMTGGVKIVNSMTIGPSLGKQAIKDGMLSFVFALVLLMIFMCAFYGLIPGLIANLGLVFNIFFTFGILASFQAVLTLSGIAGVVLALGMAVDANVLIFERAKEELRAGKNLRNAIADGYSNAFSAIFDSNLTSVITGVILLLFGTGPIKGFATTLIIGIVCSFFTAVFLTRLVFMAFQKTKAFGTITFSTGLSRKMFTNTHINFLGKRKVAFGVVLALCAVFVISLCTKSLNPGIDFSGGRNYMVQFDRDQVPSEMAEDLAVVFDGNKPTVITIDNPSKVRITTNYLIDDESQNVDSLIMVKLYEAFSVEGKPYSIGDMSFADFSASNESMGIISTQKVGPTVANEMRTDAYIAVGLSLLAMFLYILLRFRNIAFSVGALAAVAFTAFSIVGFYSIFWGVFPFAMEIDQSFIAAILTVIGYQINDTVVVFDRVRENVGLYPKQNFATTINQSLNSTLGRTVMTSASTLLVLLCIFILGGDAIRSFTFAMIFGVVIGTLATIFVAAPVAYLTDARKNKTNKAKA